MSLFGAALQERARRRLKRRLLAEVVEDNLAQMRGGPPAKARRRRLLGSLRLLALALLPLSLLAPSHSTLPPPAAAEPAVAGAEPAPRPDGGTEGAVRPAPPAQVAPVPVDPAVFPLAVERVVIDPGHGGRNSGTRTPSGLLEKDLVLDIGQRLAALLRDAGFDVSMTRDDDTALSLEERASFANREGADLFISIHVNWITNRTVRGVETYFLGTTDDPFLTRLAAEENRGSGYSQSDLRDLLEEIYSGFRESSSERLARHLQRSLLRSLRTVNPAVEDRGVKTAPFIVLMKTDMPAVLAEVSCLSNQKEAELLGRSLYRQYIAEALLHGIESYAAATGGSDGDATTIAGDTGTHQGARS